MNNSLSPEAPHNSPHNRITKFIKAALAGLLGDFAIKRFWLIAVALLSTLLDAAVDASDFARAIMSGQSPVANMRFMQEFHHHARPNH